MTSIGQITQEVARTNPWWRSDDWGKTDADLRHARKSSLGYKPDCLDDLTIGALYLLRGPRRVGKTVSVKQAIDELLASAFHRCRLCESRLMDGLQMNCEQ